MGNVLLQHQNRNNTSFQDLARQAMALGPSDLAAQKLYDTNPKFRELADSIKGLTPEQACSIYGANFNSMLPFRW